MNQIRAMLICAAFVTGCAGSPVAPTPESDPASETRGETPAEIHSAFRDWISAELPSSSRTAWLEANRSDEWEVAWEDGRVQVRRWVPGIPRGELPPVDLLQDPEEREEIDEVDEFFGNAVGRRVADGWVVAFDDGEWGASVWWYSSSGGDRYRVSGHHLRCFVTVGDSVLAITGYAHLDTSRGSVLRLTQDSKGRWTLVEVADLGGAARTSTASRRNGVYVATNGLLHVSLQGEVEVIVPDLGWSGLYPTSMVLTPDDCLYVAMRQGVAKIEQVSTSPAVSWLVPKSPGADD